LVNEVLEVERRLTSRVDPSSPFNFPLHQLDYSRLEDATEHTKRGEYNLFETGAIDLPTQIESEEVTVAFEEAVTGAHTAFRTSIQHKTWTADEIAEQLHQRLKSIDEESLSGEDEPTEYARRFTVERCAEIVQESLRRVGVTSDRVTDANRQRFLQALGPLRRKAARRVVYRMSPSALRVMNTGERQAESCSAAELRRGSKTVFYPPGCEETLPDEQREFFEEVHNEDGDFVQGRVKVENAADFKSCSNFVIADANPERRFVRESTECTEARRMDEELRSRFLFD
jgi:type III restriction enzyme